MNSRFKIYAALVMLLLGVGCQRDFEHDITPRGSQIAFDATVDGQRRAEVLSAKERFDNFGAYGFSYAGIFEEEIVTEYPAIDNYQVSYTEGVWQYAPTRMWPDEAYWKTSIFAYAPYSESEDSGISAVNLDDKGLTLDFKVQSENEKQQDLKISATQTFDQAPEGAVNMVFSHQLTKIAFKVKGDNTLTISSLAIKGAYDGGTLNVDLAGHVKWSNLAVSDPALEYKAALVDDCSLDGLAESKVLTTADGYLMLIPQLLPEEAVIVAKYTTLDAPGQTLVQEIPIGRTTWLANKQYSYVLKIKNARLSFLAQDIEIDDWGRAFNYEFDENGEVVIPLTDYIDFAVYKTNEELTKTIAERAAKGITDFTVVGKYYEGALGNGSVLGSGIVVNNPFMVGCPGITSIDLSRVEGLTSVPSAAFANTALDFNAEPEDLGITLEPADEGYAEQVRTAMLEAANSSLKKVVLPESVVSVGMAAFMGCAALEEINLENIVSTSLASFSNCVSLKELDAPNLICSVLVTFANCVSIESVNLDSYETGFAVFVGLSSLAEVNLPSYAALGPKEFTGCPKLETLVLEKCVSLAGSCIQDCDNLTRIELTSPADIETTYYTEGSSIIQIIHDSFLGFDTENCDLVLHANKQDEVSGNRWRNWNWRSISFVGDPNYSELGGRLSLDDYNTVEKLAETLKVREAEGVKRYIVKGAMFDGALGQDYDAANPDSHMSNPFMLYAKSASTIDLSEVTGLGSASTGAIPFPQGVFSPGLDQYGDVVESNLLSVEPPESMRVLDSYVLQHSSVLLSFDSHITEYKDYAAYNYKLNYKMLGMSSIYVSNAIRLGKSAFESTFIESFKFSEATNYPDPIMHLTYVGERAFANNPNMLKLEIEGTQDIEIDPTAFDETDTEWVDLRLDIERIPGYGADTYPAVDAENKLWAGHKWMNITYVDGNRDYVKPLTNDVYITYKEQSRYANNEELLADIRQRSDAGVRTFNFISDYTYENENYAGSINITSDIVGEDLDFTSGEEPIVNNPLLLAAPEAYAFSFGEEADYAFDKMPAGAFFPGYADYANGVLKESPLTYVSLQGVSELGAYAFYGCKNLRTVALSGSINLQPYTFYGCESLTQLVPVGSFDSYNVGGSMIGEHAFDGCSSIKRIAMDDFIETIGAYAFNGCESLTRLTFGGYSYSNETIVDADAFTGFDTTKCTLLLAKEFMPADYDPANKMWFGKEWAAINFEKE